MATSPPLSSRPGGGGLGRYSGSVSQCHAFPRRAASGLNSGTSLERIALESLTQALCGFVPDDL
jgi:hypothetical protein